jgi:hypothetical protein
MFRPDSANASAWSAVTALFHAGTGEQITQTIDHGLRRLGNIADAIGHRLGAEPIGIEPDATGFSPILQIAECYF